MKTSAFIIALVVSFLTANAHFSTDYKTNVFLHAKIENEPPVFEPWRVNNPTPILDVEIVVFPNPTAQFVQIHIDGFGPLDLRYEILNLLGQVVDRGDIVNNRTQIDLTNQEYSTYILNIFDSENRFIRSIQLVKEH